MCHFYYVDKMEQQNNKDTILDNLPPWTVTPTLLSVFYKGERINNFTIENSFLDFRYNIRGIVVKETLYNVISDLNKITSIYSIPNYPKSSGGTSPFQYPSCTLTTVSNTLFLHTTQPRKINAVVTSKLHTK